MNEFYPNTTPIDEQEIAYIDAKTQFLSRIDTKSPRWVIAIQKLNLPNIERKYIDIQWKYGQLRRAISYYDNIIEITDSAPENLPIWTPSEQQRLCDVMRSIYPHIAVGDYMVADTW